LPATYAFSGSSESVDNHQSTSIKADLSQDGIDNFRAHLNGDENVPSSDTTAQGELILMFNKDTDTLNYTLIAANTEDVFASHIHCGRVGENGPVGVTLFFSSEPVSKPDGVLMKGTISEPDPGNVCSWYSLADVEAAIRAGNAYVNMHSSENRPGEIRGQIH